MASTVPGVWVVPRTTAREDTDEAKVRHPNHNHALAICYLDLDGTVCQECSQTVGGRAYGCEDCDYYLHLWCLPKVHTQLHPKHPLILRYTDGDGMHHCQICELGVYLTFHCDPCGFQLCVYCMSLAPAWRFELDGHPFASIEVGVNEDSLVAKFFRGRACPICSKSGDTKFFKCMSPGCSSFCHFHCIPFDVPKSIKHEYHYHPLSFTESYAEDGGVVHYCDACEEERDPEAPVYCCEECDFSAHTACAISKVLPALIAEREANPSMVPVPLCLDPVRTELNNKIDRLLHEENYHMGRLEEIVAEMEKTETMRATYSAFTQREEYSRKEYNRIK
ncbi:uncharacterized protein LOC116210166 [Punica granatum]|uniref:Uncharacterized protein LOC116189801 n=2 Tax=Punica granatum TaxID=22663 RepID=A0A6P8BWL7_PUNGR|nr:uncharacterized protein LOC116189801 [Punica granatum]XP_031399848.1 uncharacterized protein LOC116210166 [Punica granatum]OWM86022.1 hypothetical protein CDL15_Pgr027248 [Punica granatum]PKI69623.1 hypothetical protein CRG98_009978 [Punica granatum]